MEAAMENQMNRAGELMKEFVDTVFGFYQNIRQEDVLRQPDEETLRRLMARHSAGRTPGRRGLRGDAPRRVRE